MFEWIGKAFSSVKSSVDGFLVANPLVKNLLDGVVKAGLVAGLTVVSSALAPASATAITVSGIIAAVSVGVKTYAQHQADVYVQSQINSLVPTSPVVSTSVPVAPSVTK